MIAPIGPSECANILLGMEADCELNSTSSERYKTDITPMPKMHRAAQIRDLKRLVAAMQSSLAKLQ